MSESKSPNWRNPLFLWGAKGAIEELPTIPFPQSPGDLAQNARIQNRALPGRTSALLLQMAGSWQRNMESLALLADAPPRAARSRRVQPQDSAAREDHCR